MTHATDALCSVCRLTLAAQHETMWSDMIDAWAFARQMLMSAFVGLTLRRRVALRYDRRRMASVGLPSNASVGMKRGLELSVPRLSQRQTLVASASDASDAGSRPLVFKRAVDTWRRLRAKDARVASVGLATDASVAPEISPVNC
jgi:hypothetical protein